MLARDVLSAASAARHLPVCFSHRQLDITDANLVQECLSQQRPDAIVNCAAFTDVDGAQSHPDRAFAVNAAGAANLASAAASLSIPMLHVSTDYVFGGDPRTCLADCQRPYVESDEPAPLNVYGESKLRGERLVLAASDEHLVVRTSWLFGAGGVSFVSRMLQLASQRRELQVVDDQVGCPTWTGHLAPALIDLLQRRLSGLVHLCGSGHVSWHRFAQEIFEQANCPCRLHAIRSDALPRPARRPAFSALQSERADVVALPDWREGLACHLAAAAEIIEA